METPAKVTVPALFADMEKQTHVLIAGATGSGKSVAENGLLCTIAKHNTPRAAGLVLLDPKKVELYQYTQLPHTIGYADEPGEIAHKLRQVVALMDARYKQMKKRGLRKWDSGKVYVVIDELADLMTTNKAECVPPLRRLAQLGRAAGIGLIVCTQRPTADVIPKFITVNIDARLALHTVTAQDSRNIINTSGAELLPRYGKGLYFTPDTCPAALVDIPYTTQEQTQTVIDFWKDWKEPRRR